MNAKEEAALLAKMKADFQEHDFWEGIMAEARGALDLALKNAVAAGALPTGKTLAPYTVERPGDAKNGDVAANIAMVNAKTCGMAPRAIAGAMQAHFPPLENSCFSRVTVAGPGFINLYLSPSAFASAVMAAVVCGEAYGRTGTGAGQKVNVEFVSANPTGPMHLGNARGGALGDCLAAVLSWAGYNVSREFYINDAGNQIAKFGKSLSARYLQILHGEDAVPFPEDGYQGEDIRERAQEFFAQHGGAYGTKDEAERANALVAFALPRNIQKLKDDMAKYRVEYDTWFSESTLHAAGAVQQAVDTLAARGATYEKDGAVWYKATAYGEEKDEVLVRANGYPTYFAADIAYHVSKFERGFTRAIDVWGADHHGHVARMKGAMQAMGYDPARLDIVLYQFVRLVQDGQPVRMSKRTGKAIALTDLLDEVPIDSARFFFNLREPGSVVEFDLDLAVAEDSENPVYYVQYAHARICSLLRTMEEAGSPFSATQAFGNLGKLESPEERALIRRVAAFPGEISGAAKAYDPARVTRALVDTATDFHRFYTKCRIKGEEAGLLQARLALALAAKNVLANGLTLLKVSVPEKM